MANGGYKAIEYAEMVVNRDIPAPIYVVAQCEEFLRIANDENEKYFLCRDTIDKINNATKLMQMASGLRVGATVYNSLAGFQWLFIVAILCVKYRDNTDKRRYEMATLLIARKCGKTFLVSVIFALLFIIEPKFSEFYSVAADGSLSRIVKKELDQLLESSPSLSKHFNIKRDEIECTLNKSKYVPLNYSNNRLDGRKANVFLADEVGALPERYAISAMKSSQINMLNRLGILISTAYPSLDNPMVDEIDYAKKVLDGNIDDEAYFSLLYEPDNKDKWQTDDSIIFHSNPLALEIDENLQEVYKLRKIAIEMPSERTNFLTKHLNIFVQSNQSEAYVKASAWKKNGIDKIDFTDKEVVVGWDLSLTTDLTGVVMMYKENSKYYIKAIGFLPEGSLLTRREKFDYRESARSGECVLCQGDTVSHYQVEEYIRDIEKKFGCRIKAIVGDPAYANNMVESLGADYDVIPIKQYYNQLSSPTKELRNEIYAGNVVYEKSKLFDWCVMNATTCKDRFEREILDKSNKNKGRIDLLAATIFAFAECCNDDEGWTIQVI